MALKTKPNGSGEQSPHPEAGSQAPKSETPRNGVEANNPRPPRVNEDVERRLNPYIAANKGDFERYTKLVNENPERAVRTLMLKDLDNHEAEMRFTEKQLPAAKEWYGKQSAEVKKMIDERVAESDPYYKTKAFVNAVVRERNWQNRLPLAQQPVKAAMSVG
jgi:hypothetical protein